jgi:hypothetical protein
MIRDKLSDAREALLGDGEPDVQTQTRRLGYQPYRSGGIDSITPTTGELDTYWEQYQTCPLVRIPIRMYAEDIIEPGYRVDIDDDSLAEKLESWLEEAAIIAGESDRDVSQLFYNKIIQKEVRGTGLTEIVPQEGNEDNIWGFRLINVATVNGYTYEDKAILIQPEDTDHDGVLLTDRGEAAAYGQWDSNAFAGPFDDKNTVFLSQNDVVKMTQDEDTSEIFGTSTIEPVSDQIEELRQMLNDTSEAVHSKAWPHWIFKLGEPNGDISNPRAGIWPEEEIKNYRNSHKGGEWSAGQKDFVPGDVGVEVIDSDVPEIKPLLNWYVEQIITAMPTPKYKIGHADSVNRDITKTQQEQYERKVKQERRRLERAFTPVIRRKARELGASEELASSVELKIEEDRTENPLERDDFDSSEFAEFAQGINNLAGEGSPSEIVKPDEVREMLGLTTRANSEDEDDGDDFEDEMASLDEDDKEVQAQFEELYGEPLTPEDGGTDEQSAAPSAD